MVDFRVNYQRLRHSNMARRIRSFVYKSLVGADAWPLTFRRPESSDALEMLSSSHLYVHIPFCQTICPHCPYNKRLYDEALYANYRVALLEEIRSFLGEHPHCQIESLYFGGGTPSLTPDLLEEVIDLLSHGLSETSEIGVEVHPIHASQANLARLRSMKVNRISLGIETFNEEILRKLGRGYSQKQAIMALEAAKAVGFECVDVNLIYGIPGQTGDEVLENVQLCIDQNVDQISAYPLFSFVHTPLGKQVATHKSKQYGEIARLKVQQNISESCFEAGYQRSSVWSYTKPAIAPYSTVTRNDYLGFGAGAGSKVDRYFWFNTFSVEEYAKIRGRKPALVMMANERLEKMHWVYWQIYKTWIDFSEYRQKFGVHIEDDFYLLIQWLRLLGWGKITPGGMRITEKGAVWAHKLQSLYSLSYIDKLWQTCQDVPWPKEVILE